MLITERYLEHAQARTNQLSNQCFNQYDGQQANTMFISNSIPVLPVFNADGVDIYVPQFDCDDQPMALTLKYTDLSDNEVQILTATAQRLGLTSLVDLTRCANSFKVMVMMSQLWYRIITKAIDFWYKQQNVDAAQRQQLIKEDLLSITQQTNTLFPISLAEICGLHGFVNDLAFNQNHYGTAIHQELTELLAHNDNATVEKILTSTHRIGRLPVHFRYNDGVLSVTVCVASFQPEQPLVTEEVNVKDRLSYQNVDDGFAHNVSIDSIEELNTGDQSLFSLDGFNSLTALALRKALEMWVQLQCKKHKIVLFSVDEKQQCITVNDAINDLAELLIHNGTRRPSNVTPRSLQQAGLFELEFERIVKNFVF